MNKDTRNLLIGAAIIGGGLWWWKSKKSTSVTNAPTVQAAMFSPLALAQAKLCTDPTLLSDSERQMLLDQVAVPLYRNIVAQLGRDPGPGELDLYLIEMRNEMVANCNPPNANALEAALSLARGAWMKETGGGG